MTEYKLFIREVKKQIAVRGLSQYEVADMIGASQPWVNHILNGDRTPNVHHLFSLARVLGIDLGQIQREAYRVS